MRVIAGRWRGRRLTAPAGLQVRPTTDRVKEAVFSILAGAVPGAVVLDLCCGSGGLGIEALSRGAVRAVFVDSNATALAAVQANLQVCRAGEGSYTLVRQDALAFLDRWLRLAGAEPWVLLCDPPYAQGLAEAILGRAGGLVDAPGFRAAAVEHERSLDGQALSDGLGRVRRYGTTCVTILRPRSEGRDPDE